MTKRPIDGPSRRIIFHPFPAIGWKSMIWQAIKGPILIADGFQSYQSWGMNGPQKTGIFILPYFHRRSDSAADFQSYQSWGMNDTDCQGLSFGQNSNRGQSWGTIGPKTTNILILSHFHRGSTLHRIDQSMTKKVTDLQKDGRKKT